MRIRHRVEGLIRQPIDLLIRFVKTVISERHTNFLTQSLTKIQREVEILARRLTYPPILTAGVLYSEYHLNPLAQSLLKIRKAVEGLSGTTIDLLIRAATMASSENQF